MYLNDMDMKGFTGDILICFVLLRPDVFSSFSFNYFVFCSAVVFNVCMLHCVGVGLI